MSTTTSPVDRMRTFAFANSTTVLNSSQIWLAGCQAIMQSVTMDAQARVEQGWSNWTSLTKAKSLHEALEMQAGFAHAVVRGSLDGSLRLTKASAQLMQKTMAPIAERMTSSAEVSTAPSN